MGVGEYIHTEWVGRLRVGEMVSLRTAEPPSRPTLCLSLCVSTSVVNKKVSCHSRIRRRSPAMRRHQHGRVLRETLSKHLQIIKQQLERRAFTREAAGIVRKKLILSGEQQAEY